MTDFKQQLIAMNACDEAIEWVGERGLKTAWTECERGDWMLCLASRVDIDRKLLVLAACDCAEPELEFVPEGEDRPRIAIETARKWCAGNATLEEVIEAANKAAWAARAADADEADRAARAAAEASWAARTAAEASWAAGIGIKSLADSADLVRQRISVELIERVMT